MLSSIYSGNALFVPESPIRMRFERKCRLCRRIAATGRNLGIFHGRDLFAAFQIFTSCETARL